MARSLTPKRKGFVKDYLATGNATLAVKRNYNVSSDESAATVGSELLRIPKVRDYIESKAERAAEIVYEIAETSENDGIRLSAAKDIQDRAGLKPVEKSLVLNANMEITTQEDEELASKLMELERDNG